jgi:CHAT domain-containing protein
MYISSYTPTLSALITSRNPGARKSGLPNILLVALPDSTLPGVSAEVRVIQSLNLPVTSVISQSATPSAVLDGLRCNQFCHFACHGALTTGKPFEASFLLYKERLTLLDIVRSRLAAGECAFLATCHTAELSDGGMPDEVLHLSAAMQYSGFRSVIGTMWEMADEDGQYLAKCFYESMFSDSDERQGLPYHERSAWALAAAVRILRERRVSPERWVNYVHFGA